MTKEFLFHFFRKLTSILVACVGIQIGNHSRLCVAGIALYRFNVTAAELQLHGGTTMAETVKNNGGEFVRLIEFADQIGDLPLLVGATVFMQLSKR